MSYIIQREVIYDRLVRLGIQNYTFIILQMNDEITFIIFNIPFQYHSDLSKQSRQHLIESTVLVAQTAVLIDNISGFP